MPIWSMNHFRPGSRFWKFISHLRLRMWQNPGKYPAAPDTTGLYSKQKVMPDKNPDKTSCKDALPEFLVGIHLPFVQPHPIMPQIKTLCQPQHFTLSSPQFPPLLLVDEDGKEKPRADFLGVSPNLLPPNSQLKVSGAAGMKSQAMPITSTKFNQKDVENNKKMGYNPCFSEGGSGYPTCERTVQWIFTFSPVWHSEKQVKTFLTSRWLWRYHFGVSHVFCFLKLTEFTPIPSRLDPCSLLSRQEPLNST